MTDLKNRPMDPSIFFLIASLLVGILYCITIPYGAGFDEERHLVRIYYISQNHWLPNFPNATIYEDLIELSYQRRLVQSPAFDMFSSRNFWKKIGKLEKNIRYGVKTQSIYSPLIFLPQALVAKIFWWRLDFAILPTIILMRIAGLSLYVAGGYFAIRAVPYGKWIVAALALTPAALYQAATLNADGFTYAVSFAFIGWTFYVYIREKEAVQARSVWILVVLSILLGAAKPGAIILLPLLLILLKHPFPAKRWVMLLAAGVLISIAANVGWWLVATPGSVFSGKGAQSLGQQSGAIFSDPRSFIKPLIQGMVLTLPSQIQGWMAAYGYWAGRVPGPVYFFVLLFLVAAFLAEPRLVRMPTGTRLFFVGLFLFCCAATYTIAFVPNYITGGVLALAKHGRYYIPFTPLLFLGITGWFVIAENLQRIAKFVAVGSFLLATGWFVFGIYTTYYTYCGYDSYIGQKCVLPIYKNLEKEDTLEVEIREQMPITQTFTKQCGSLEMVQVFVKSVSENSQGSLRFSLLDESNRIVASQDFPMSRIIAQDYLGLPVPPGSISQSTNYEIQLDSMNLAPHETITVALTTSNFYPGEFSANGITTRDDLLIHYICTGP